MKHGGVEDLKVQVLFPVGWETGFRGPGFKDTKCLFSKDLIIVFRHSGEGRNDAMLEFASHSLKAWAPFERVS